MRPRLVAPALAALLAPALALGGVRPAYGGTIRIGVPSLPGDPGGGAAEALVERATSAPLLELGAAGELVPGALAEVPVPEAGARAYRLRLRPGLCDALGRPLAAADVAARLAALLAKAPPSPDAWAALPVLGADAVMDGRAPVLAGVQVLSATELLVTLALPLPEFPFLLASPALALPGAGPFAGPPRRGPEGLVLPANDRHYRGRPFASAIRLTAVDLRGASRLLEQGALDLVLRPESIGGRSVPGLVNMTVVVAALSPRLGASAGAVRGALAALDRAELARRFVRGPAEPLATILPSAILPDPPRASPAPSPTGAIAGRLALLVDASTPDGRSLADRLQVKLFDRGLRASVELVDGLRYRARLAAGDYDIALVAVRVQTLKPALAASQLAFAVRGAAAARRTLSALAGLEGDRAVEAAARAGHELDLVPLVATGVRASAAPSLEGLKGRVDGAIDFGAAWLLGFGGPP